MNWQRGTNWSGGARTFVDRCVASVVRLGSLALTVSSIWASAPGDAAADLLSRAQPPQSPATAPALPPAKPINVEPVQAADPVTNNEAVLGARAQENVALRRSRDLFGSLPLSNQATAAPPSQVYQKLLESAWQQKRANKTDAAEKSFVRLLESDASDDLKKTALLELAVLAHERQDLIRAQQVYAQFISHYAADASVPEVLLRQGLLYREMGAPVMALSKFYAVMSSALSLKLDRLEYYQGLVLRAQSEIAETFYLQGKYDDAVEFFGRLMKLDAPGLDKAQILSKLIRCLAARDRTEEIIAQAGIFLNRYAESDPAPEVRFLLAQALKKNGRNREAMEEVLALLQSQRPGTNQDSQSWTYWRQRTGNQIANQLYQEGDFPNALQIYLGLVNLSKAPDWQIPALYQAGLVYERLQQPEKASEIYDRIAGSHRETNAAPLSPSLVAVLDMAKWRKGFLGWQQHAGESNQQVTSDVTPLPTP